MNRQEILDPETSWEIMRIFEQINARGTTIVMATHNREIVNTIRHRVIVWKADLSPVMSTEVSTAMKARTFGRHVRESLKSLRRNSWMTFASVSAVTVTLLLVGVFIVIMMNLNQLADNIENDVEIKVVADPAADKAAVKELVEKDSFDRWRSRSRLFVKGCRN